MDKQKCLDLAAYSAISCSAYFAGASLYINWVQVPSMFTTAPDTRTLLAEWREMYTRARVIQVITCNGARILHQLNFEMSRNAFKLLRGLKYFCLNVLFQIVTQK